jgi:CRISPR-associated Csx10 family RAMP protein
MKPVTQIGLSITTMSPLLLSAGPPAGNLIEALDFIPGNTIRGLLARKYMTRSGKPEDDIFRRLFLSGETHFGFASINGSQIIPLSARSCKYNSGFVDDKEHGVIDILLPDPDKEEKRCIKANCKHPVDYLEGFWNPETCKKEKVGKLLITRTAIDSVRSSASHEQLYSQRVIEEGQTFVSAIEIPNDLVSDLRVLLKRPFTAYIGKGRSRGQGWVKVKEAEPPILFFEGTLKERFERFNNDKGLPLLAVTLLSDAIFHDKYLRDCTAPDVSHLKPLGIKENEWKLKHYRAFASQRLVYGFDGEPLQLPRQPRLAVASGSVFLFEPEDGVKPTDPNGNGIGWIGDNNREGFGQAVLWHPFHYQYQYQQKRRRICE